MLGCFLSQALLAGPGWADLGLGSMLPDEATWRPRVCTGFSWLPYETKAPQDGGFQQKLIFSRV